MALRKRNMTALGCISTLLVTVCLIGFVTEVGAETRKFRTVGQFSRVEVMPVGDVEGHLLGIFEFRGLAFIDGDVAVLTGWTQCDVIKGTGSCQNYVKQVYEDGSTIVFKGQFDARIAPDGKTGLYENGKGEYIMGTGRFTGIKGTLSYTGKRITPISPGLKETRGDFITEGTGTYTLPSK